MTVKVVYNACFGGYGISKKAIELYKELSGNDLTNGRNILRHDKYLVQVVEMLGKEAGGDYSELKIAEVSTGRYFIDDYDGFESVVTENNIKWVYCDSDMYPEEFL